MNEGPTIGPSLLFINSLYFHTGIDYKSSLIDSIYYSLVHFKLYVSSSPSSKS